jgi:hypothetical protein
MSEHISELAEALARRERKVWMFDVNAIFGVGATAFTRIGMRVATKAEHDRAVLGAHAYVAERAKASQVDGKIAAEDGDILIDAKTAHILFEICRDAADPKYPAFPGPRWIVEHLTPDEMGVLLNLYAEVIRATATIDFDLSPGRLDALAKGFAALADTDQPNELLARFTRSQVSEMLIRLSVLYCAADVEQ